MVKEEVGSKNDEKRGPFIDWRPCLPESDPLGQDYMYILKSDSIEILKRQHRPQGASLFLARYFEGLRKKTPHCLREICSQ